MILPSDPAQPASDTGAPSGALRLLAVLSERSVLKSATGASSELPPGFTVILPSDMAEAESAVRLGGYDILVTEPRLRDGDGVGLLELAERTHPEKVRVLLTRHQQDLDPRMLRVAHQVMGEDITPRLLLELAAQTRRLLPLITDLTMKRALGSLSHLPPAPKLYHQLTQLLVQQESSVDDVAALLMRDPQLCAKLLQVANSAFFSRRGRTLDLRPAIVRLGMNTIRSLLLSVEVFDQSGAFAAVAGAELDMAQLEAQRLAELCERLSLGSRWSGQAYVVGLLADIGQLLLLLTTGHAWRECKSLALRQRRPLHEVERERLGVSHPEVGAYLLGLWGLPFGLAEAVAHHHTPTGELVAHFNLSAVVAIAAALQGRITIDEPWLVGMKVKTKVELLRQSLSA